MNDAGIRSKYVYRIDVLESLRGLMALWVVLGHILLTFPPGIWQNSFILSVIADNGRPVKVFIILSGFVIFHLLHNGQERFGPYILRRFFRLFPAYFLIIVISAMILPLSLEAVETFASITPRNAQQVFILTNSINEFWPHFVSHFTMLHGLIPNRFLPATDYAILGQAWSISVEWQFYLIAPLIYWLFRTTLKLYWAVLITLVAGLYWAHRFFGSGYFGAYTFFFAIGGISCILWSVPNHLTYLIARHSNFIVPITSLIWLVVFPQTWEVAIWIALFLSCLTARTEQTGTELAVMLQKILLQRPLRWLGRISYSVYLSHMIPLYLCLWLLRNSALSQEVMLGITLIVTVSVTLVGSEMLYRGIEKPFIDLGRVLAKPTFKEGPTRSTVQQIKMKFASIRMRLIELSREFYERYRP